MATNNPALGTQRYAAPVQHGSIYEAIRKFFMTPALGRQAKGRRIANSHLAQFRDSTLRELGYSQARIDEVRRSQTMDPVIC